MGELVQYFAAFRDTDTLMHSVATLASCGYVQPNAGNIQDSLIVEPMLFVTPGVFGEQRKSYLIRIDSRVADTAGVSGTLTRHAEFFARIRDGLDWRDYWQSKPEGDSREELVREILPTLIPFTYDVEYKRSLSFWNQVK